MPKLTYSASMLEIPDRIVRNTNKIFFKFIWGKTEKVQQRVHINTYENGGLQMIDLENHLHALKAAWVPRIYDDSKSAWKHLPLSYIKKTTLDFLSLNQKTKYPF